MHVAKTFNLTNHRVLNIIADDDPESPRECDNNGTMVCFHGRYNLGDKHDYRSEDFSGWEALKAQIEEDHDVVVILPLYLFDHSGITISTDDTQFRMADGAGWDWGQVGWIFATRENLKKGGHPDDVEVDKVETWLRGEVETYNQFLRGEIYGFQLHGKPCPTCEDEGEVTDSCWGFYGSNPLENGMRDHLGEDVCKELVALG
jgi:hypothetical protein